MFKHVLLKQNLRDAEYFKSSFVEAASSHASFSEITQYQVQ